MMHTGELQIGKRNDCLKGKFDTIKNKHNELSPTF